MAFAAAKAAYEIDRVEVSRRPPDAFLIRIVKPHLRRFDDLQRWRLVLRSDPERCTTRFPVVPHDPADAHRSIKGFDGLESRLIIRDLRRIRTPAEMLGRKSQRGISLSTIGSGSAATHERERLSLKMDEMTDENPFPIRDLLESFLSNDVVDVLGDNDVAAGLLEVSEKRAVATRSQEKSSVRQPEWFSGPIDCHRVGRRMLLRECHVENAVPFLFETRSNPLELRRKRMAPLTRNREMKPADMIETANTSNSLAQLLLERCTWAGRVVMKEDQTLGKTLIAESVRLQQKAHNITPLVGPRRIAAQHSETLPKGEFVSMFDQTTNRIRRRP